jgi:hypothetical protein
MTVFYSNTENINKLIGHLSSLNNWTFETIPTDYFNTIDCHATFSDVVRGRFAYYKITVRLFVLQRNSNMVDFNEVSLFITTTAGKILVASDYHMFDKNPSPLKLLAFKLRELFVQQREAIVSQSITEIIDIHDKADR